jgi:hypothetical protein
MWNGNTSTRKAKEKMNLSSSAAVAAALRIGNTVGADTFC